MTLLSRLFVLVAVALLPAIAIQAYNEFDLRRARQVEVQNQALSLAKLAAAEQQQIVQGIRQVLIAMSELPAIKARDSQACNAYRLAMQQRFPAFITLLVADLNGRSFCDTNSDHRPITIAARLLCQRLENRRIHGRENSRQVCQPAARSFSLRCRSTATMVGWAASS